jgi:nucleoside-diphosphate-sugar epimerase
MRIFVAGGSGAIGRPLVRQLVERGHSVIGMTGHESSARTLADLGAEPVVADALDAEAVATVVRRARPEVVINQLTSLPKHYTSEEMTAAAPRDRRLRLDGGAHLLRAAREAGARRFVIASGCYFSAPGEGLADEEAPFALDASPGVAAGARLLAELERRVLSAGDVEGVALRYGFFYGPRTWYWPDGDVASQMRAGSMPIIGDGRGVWSFVHVDDAAAATVAAVDRAHPPGVYVVTDDRPDEVRVLFPAFARWVGAPPPRQIEASADLDADAVYYATRLRGASNAKARRELGFAPRPLAWLFSD